MSKQDIYRLLEEKMLNYKDYADVSVELVDEPLVPIPASANLYARQIDADMQAYTGERVFVRRTVLQKLKQAAKLLAGKTSAYSLKLYTAIGRWKSRSDCLRNTRLS
jgi:hypothetical protein